MLPDKLKSKNSSSALIKPQELRNKYKPSGSNLNFIHKSRSTIANILQGVDKRLLVIIGPCSIHDHNSCLEYAQHIKQAQDKYNNELFIVMRSYFQKPRTSIGWKGLINDPKLDESFDINYGLELSRKILLDLCNIELPASTEFLDIFTCNYLEDLISFNTVGARTVESQTVREFSSNLKMPIGFKNNTDGNIKVAIDAIRSAKEPQCFLGVDNFGDPSIINTTGNPNGTIILRGSNTSTNYQEKAIYDAAKQLDKFNLRKKLIVDCSHGNSRKNHLQQIDVISDIICQLNNKDSYIAGVMLESNLIEGNQKPGKNLIYGKSITDSCIGIKDSLKILETLALEVKKN